MPFLVQGSNVTFEVGAKHELIIEFLITASGEEEQGAEVLGQRGRVDRAGSLESGGPRF